MPATPISSNTSVRADLAAFFEFDLEMEKREYIGTKVLPVVDTLLSSDDPGKIPLESLLQEVDTTRSSGSGYNRGSWKFDRFNYSTRENGWEEPVDERDKKRLQDLLQIEQISYSRAVNFVMKNHEKRVADLVFNPTTWTGGALTTGVVNEWDDADDATPIVDVNAARLKVYEGSGLWPNALIINKKVFHNLRQSEEIIDRINSAGAGNASKATDITAAMLAAVFDLDFILIGGGTKNNAKEGQPASPAQIWDDEYAMVCRIATSVDMREPCIGRTFHWSEDGSQVGGAVEEYYSDEVRSKIIRVRHDTDEVIMYPQAGHLLSNITT
jgi:hypothetical protein